MTSKRLACLGLPFLLAAFALAAPDRAYAASGPALSVFEPAGPGMQRWVKLDPLTGRRQVLASLPATTGLTAVAWSGDGAHALLMSLPKPSNSPDDPIVPATCWQVELGRGHVAPLALPAAGALIDLGYDRQNRVIAVSARKGGEFHGKPGHFFVRDDGRLLALDPHGEGGVSSGEHALLLEAWRLENNRWHKLDVRATYPDQAEFDAATESMAMASVKGMTSHPLLALDRPFEHLEALAPNLKWTSFVDRDGLGGQLTAIGKRLDRLTGQHVASAHWHRLSSPTGTFYMERAIGLQGDSQFSAPLVFERHGQLQRAEHFDSADLGTRYIPTVRGSLVLLSAYPERDHPRCYDLASGRLLFASETVRGAEFWPAQPTNSGSGDRALVVPGVGVGELHLGQPVPASFLRQMPKPITNRKPTSDEGYIAWGKPAKSANAEDANEDFSITLANAQNGGVVWGIAIEQNHAGWPAFHTAEGIRIGSTYAAVKRAYPGGKVSPGGMNYDTRYSLEDRGIEFLIGGDRVGRIQLFGVNKPASH